MLLNSLRLMDMKRMNWLLGSVLAMLLVPTHSSAQDVCDSINEDDIVIDSVYTETGEIVADTFRLGERKKEIPQYEIKEHDWVDLCANPKYAVVTKGGKQGIYDMILHQNITEIEFDELGFYRQTEAEEDVNIVINMFYAKKGSQTGILGVCENDNSILSIWMDESEDKNVVNVDNTNKN